MALETGGNAVAGNGGFEKLGHVMWMYRLSGSGTILYCLLGLFNFYFQTGYSPSYWLVTLWSISLVGYAIMNKVVQFKGIHNGGRRGEIYVAMVVSSYLLMEVTNIARVVFFHKEKLIIPDGFPLSALEALILFVLSFIGSFYIFCRRTNGNGCQGQSNISTAEKKLQKRSLKTELM